MSCFKWMGKIAIFLVCLLVCLQYSINFVDVSVQPKDDSYKVVIEFREAYTKARKNEFVVRWKRQATPESEGYQLMYQEDQVYASQSPQARWIKKGSEIRGVKSDIDHTFIEQNDGVWTVNIVFKKDFSREIQKLTDRYLDKDLAIVINSDLMAIPQVTDKFVKVNKEGQFLLSIPTNFHSEIDIDQFLVGYNM